MSRRVTRRSKHFRNDQWNYQERYDYTKYLWDKPKAGLAAAKEAANTNIEIQFGWRPLIQDLMRMFDFGTAFEARMKELNRLYSGSGLKRRMTLQTYSSSDSGTQNVYSDSITGVLSTEWTRTREYRRWGTIRWKPDDPNWRPTGSEVLRMLTGFTLGNTPSVVWELMPWSWLADYFANVSLYLRSMQNRLNCRVFDASIMTHQRTTVVYAGKSYSYGGLGTINLASGTKISERKTRSVSFATGLDVQLPILNGQQLSILSSLAIARTGSTKPLTGY